MHTPIGRAQVIQAADDVSITSHELSRNNPNSISADEQRLIYRCLKTACHEICHVLGMTHCPYFECLMNGSNLVNEADKKPFALCPICLRKVDKYYEIGSAGDGIIYRYQRLARTIQRIDNTSFSRELLLYKNLTDVLNVSTDQEKNAKMSKSGEKGGKGGKS